MSILLTKSPPKPERISEWLKKLDAPNNQLALDNLLKQGNPDQVVTTMYQAINLGFVWDKTKQHGLWKELYDKYLNAVNRGKIDGKKPWVIKP